MLNTTLTPEDLLAPMNSELEEALLYPVGTIQQVVQIPEVFENGQVVERLSCSHLGMTAYFASLAMKRVEADNLPPHNIAQKATPFRPKLSIAPTCRAHLMLPSLAPCTGSCATKTWLICEYKSCLMLW